MEKTKVTDKQQEYINANYVNENAATNTKNMVMNMSVCKHKRKPTLTASDRATTKQKLVHKCVSQFLIYFQESPKINQV